jgi:hypothetical protein
MRGRHEGWRIAEQFTFARESALNYPGVFRFHASPTGGRPGPSPFREVRPQRRNQRKLACFMMGWQKDDATLFQRAGSAGRQLRNKSVVP